MSGTKQVPDDVASILQPTSTRYKGPLDLDAAVAERVTAINASWMASEGTYHAPGTTQECMHTLTTAPRPHDTSAVAGLQCYTQ